MLDQDISQTIIKLKTADLDMRDKLIREGLLGDGYHSEMEALHNHNAEVLNGIIDDIGYPTVDKVGKEASDAAWLVIQHAISQPAFMRRCAELIAAAAEMDNASPLHLAYLTDRIAVFEGKPQSYGTQFDWDMNGQLNPNPYDDLTKVNQRRKAIGLNTLEEQTHVIRRQAEKENHLPPKDIEKRKQAYDAWRSKVGWIEH